MSEPGQVNDWRRLRRAAWVSLAVHLLAGIAMAVVLRQGLETNPDLPARLAFIIEQTTLWQTAWFIWHLAALSILYYYAAFTHAHLPQRPEMRVAYRVALLLTAAAVALDLAAEALEMGMIPKLARNLAATQTPSDLLLFTSLHRAAELMTGYGANGLYTLVAVFLAWTTRRAYAPWVWGSGLLISVGGFGLSAAVLVDSMEGMFWSNIFLGPALLAWQLGVALDASRRAAA